MTRNPKSEAAPGRDAAPKTRAGKRSSTNKTNGPTSRSQAKEFLTQIFAAELREHERIELRYGPKGQAPSMQEWFDAPETVAKRALEVADGCNVYFGAGLRNGENGSDADVTRLAAIWADVDFKAWQDSPKKARAAIDGLALPPTVIVHSGHGYQGWWFLEPPVNPGSRWRAAIDGVRAALNETATDELDNVGNLSRIMRVPGTFNMKDGEPLPVRIVDADYKRLYKLTAFRKVGLWSEGASAPAKGNSGSSRSRVRLDGPIPDGQRNVTLARIAGLMRRAGLVGEEILPSLLVINERCEPHLPENMVRDIAFGMERYPTPDLVAEVLRTARPNDSGNAQRFIALHGDNARYVDGIGWLVWNDVVYAPQRKSEVEAMAKQVAEEMATLAGQAEIAAEKDTDDAELKSTAKALSKLATSLGNVRVYRAMLESAKSEPEVAVDPADLDRRLDLFAVANGVIDLNTGECLEPRKSYLITMQSPVRYEPGATAPRFEKFVRLILADDDEKVAYLQRLFGSTLKGGAGGENQVLPSLWGDGENGKTTLLQVMRGIHGPYYAPAPKSLLVDTRNEEHPTQKAMLRGKRLVVVSETGKGRTLNEELMKELTGDGDVTARFMRQDYFQFAQTHTIMLETNYRPRISGTDHAVWRRPHLIEFPVKINEVVKKKVRRYHEVLLREEGPGILNWLIEGCLAWQKTGLNPPTGVLDATEAYKAEMTHVPRFIEECCKEGGYEVADVLYSAYAEWAKEGKGRLSKDDFGRGVNAFKAFGRTLESKTRHVQKSKLGFRADKPKQRCRVGMSLNERGIALVREQYGHR